MALLPLVASLAQALPAITTGGATLAQMGSAALPAVAATTATATLPALGERGAGGDRLDRIVKLARAWRSIYGTSNAYDRALAPPSVQVAAPGPSDAWAQIRKAEEARQRSFAWGLQGMREREEYRRRLLKMLREEGASPNLIFDLLYR